MAFYTNVTKYGNSIEYRGYDDHGKRVAETVHYEPTLFLRAEKDQQTPYTDMNGNFLVPNTYADMKMAQQDINIYAAASNSILYGSTKFTTNFLQEMFPGDISYNPDLIRIGTFDIEVDSESEFPKPEEAKHPIVSICIHSTKYDEYYVVGTHQSQKWAKENTELAIDKDKLVYLHCDTEEELLARFLELWNALDLDVVTGWFIEGFDIPYIVNRLRRLKPGIEKALSPYKRIYEREFFTPGIGNRIVYDIVGISVLDYIEVFKKFGYKWGPQESYRLDAIAYSVLGERKLNYSEYGNLHGLYVNNYQKYVDYNIRDVDLVVRIERETKLLQLAFSLAYMAGAQFEDTLGTVSIWTSFIYRHMKRKNIIPSASRKDNIKASFPGGHVKEVKPGNFNWVCSFDLNSLYPNLIVQYNMSPETITGMKDNVSVDEYLNNKLQFSGDEAVAANGASFRKDRQGLIPEIVENLYSYRKQVKAKAQQLEKDNGDKAEQFRLDNQQHAIKILLNSLYGAMSNTYFPYFDLRIAEAITLTGQLAIKWAEKTVNEFLNEGLETKNVDYVIAVDTDSLYIDLSSVTKLFEKNESSTINELDKFCKHAMSPTIASSYGKLAIVTNAFKPRMEMKREVIADRGLWTAKKRYILNVLDDEGYRLPKPKLKILGSEAIRSTTPEIIRNKMKETFKVILMETSEKAHNYMDTFKEEFLNLPVEDICFPKGVNNLEKYKDTEKIYTKGTPMHVRAALLYNDLLKKHNVLDKYQEIKSGDKIKYTYLKLPNPTRENVIAFPDILPPEFGLHEYVDKHMQFNKGFTEPMRNVFAAMNWSVDDYISIDNFLE